MTDRDKFEAFDSSYYSFLDAKPTYEKIAVFEKQAPNTIVYADHAVQVRFLNFTAAWQAATEQSQKEIELLLNQQERLIALVDEKDARIAELEARLNVDFPLLVKLFDNIDELKEREKVLVEALKSAKPVYATAKNTKAVKTGHELGGYVKDYLVSPHILHNALANVRGEVK